MTSGQVPGVVLTEAQDPGGSDRRRGGSAAIALGVVVLLWLLDVAHHGLPRRLEQIAVAVAAILAANWLIVLARRLWRGDVLDRFAGRALVLVTLVSLVVQAIGLGHEIGGLYFADEGTFLAEARRINHERALRPWFVYPHFLYYWDALALWIADLGGSLVPAAARLVWGVEGELNVGALVTRCASAALAGLAAVPVFLGARRLVLGDAQGNEAVGARAGIVAALLLALSPTFLEVSHLNISDVPAAFFTACTAYGVTLLLARPTAWRYAWTGVAAGLAAGSKYPAGVVAVAILAAWLRHVVARRRLDAGLLWAALAALAAFVLVTPSLLAFPGAVFGGEGQADILFGARLYSRSAWQGIVRQSNALYYLVELARALGWPALAFGTAGIAALSREVRRRLAWALVFPAVFLILLLTLEVALRRNLMPALPFLALGLGVGASGAADRLAARLGRPAMAAAAAVAILLSPALASGALLTRHSRASTREEAAAWMRAHLPPGSFLVQEQYTPLVAPEERFPARRPRVAARLEHGVLRDPAHDYLLLSSATYQRYLEPKNLENLANEVIAQRYREIFSSYPLVREWTPGRLQDGPALRLYRLDPETPDLATPRRLPASEAFPSDAAMRTSPGEIRFSHEGEWALFKAYLAAGTHRVRVESSSASGRLRLRTREAEVENSVELRAGEAAVAVARSGKVFLYLELSPGSGCAALIVE